MPFCDKNVKAFSNFIAIINIIVNGCYVFFWMSFGFALLICEQKTIRDVFPDLMIFFENPYVVQIATISILLAYSLLQTYLSFLLRTAIKEDDYGKLRIWYYLAILDLVLHFIIYMKWVGEADDLLFDSLYWLVLLSWQIFSIWEIHLLTKELHIQEMLLGTIGKHGISIVNTDKFSMEKD